MTNPPARPDPLTLMRSRPYIGLLLICAGLGAPIAAVAYYFLKLTSLLQQWTYTDLPTSVGFNAEPIWWPLVPLAAAGFTVGLIVRYVPGRGGEVPIGGFHPGGAPVPRALPGIAAAALISIGLGAVIGPEGPLVAIGGGLAYLMAGAVRKMPDSARRVVGGSGSFAAISTLIGTPLAAVFLLMEASGLAGAMATAVLLPGLLAAGVGALIFTGLNSATGFGTFSLAIPNLPPAGTPTLSEFGYAIALGLVAAGLCWLIHRVGNIVAVFVARRLLVVTVLVGLAIAGLAILYAEVTGHATSDVLFSGQAGLPQVVDHASEYSVGALLLLVACKGLAYSGALVAFRGGPTFPAIFIGAAGGVLASHLPGLSLVAGVAIGLGAMTAGMLKLPFSAVLVTSLVLGSDGFAVIPLTIVAVVVCHIATMRLTEPEPATPPPGAPTTPRPREPVTAVTDRPARS